MKILGISSGSKNGNNDAMCKEALMGAKETGAEVEFINLHNLELKYCTGCISCVISLFTGKGSRCVLKDDFEWLLDKMLDADGIVFASPVFVKGTPGIFHTLIDRCRHGIQIGVYNNQAAPNGLLSVLKYFPDDVK